MNYNSPLTQDTNGNYTLKRDSGSSYQLRLTIKDKDGNAFDISGKTIACYVRKYIDSTDLISENATILDQSTYLGGALWQITPTMTGTTLSRGNYIMGYTYTHDTAIIEKLIGKLVIE